VDEYSGVAFSGNVNNDAPTIKAMKMSCAVVDFKIFILENKSKLAIKKTASISLSTIIASTEITGGDLYRVDKNLNL